uniref:hypothetical protein n=1 Tax=Algoriphagus sp. TaxID=1872435 RepID=UPI00404839B9
SQIKKAARSESAAFYFAPPIDESCSTNKFVFKYFTTERELVFSKKQCDCPQSCQKYSSPI